MPDYFTRVELHQGDSSDYDTLHKEMRKRGFFQAIIGHTDTKRILPPAEYHKTDVTGRTASIRDQAKAAANLTGCKSIILTVEAVDWAADFGWVP